jgi:hypothetical protein
MRHAQHDLLEAELAAALDDLLERRDQRFAAVDAEALGALVLDVDELLEAFRLDELLQDRLLALGGEFDALVRTFDAFLYPALLFRVGHMHEFDADRRTIGPFEDLDHLAHGRIFEAEHVVYEDLAVVVLLFEAVGLRGEFVVILDRIGKAERVELGVQVAAHAIGADHHDGADGIARRLMHLGLAERHAGNGCGFLCLRLHLLFDDLFDRAPVAVEGRDEFAIGGNRPVLLLPGGALGRPHHIFGPVGKRLEEGLPLGRNG